MTLSAVTPDTRFHRECSVECSTTIPFPAAGFEAWLRSRFQFAVTKYQFPFLSLFLYIRFSLRQTFKLNISFTSTLNISSTMYAYNWFTAVVGCIFCVTVTVHAQGSPWVTDRVVRVEINMTPTDWNNMVNNPDDSDYYPANITYDGEFVSNVGVRIKGNSSRRGAQQVIDVIPRGLNRIFFKVRM